MNGDVRLGADNDVDGRRAVHPLFFHVVALAAEDRIASGGKRGEVRHLASGDEANARLPGQIEQIEEPFARYLFDDRDGWRSHEETRVLVPRAGDPIRCERDRQRAADHEAEVARAGASDGDQQIGFARAVTDAATFAYVGDVFVLAPYRGHGVSKQLMQAMRTHPDLQRLRRWYLLTYDAHALYEQFGFRKLDKPEWHMEIAVANPYG